MRNWAGRVLLLVAVGLCLAQYSYASGFSSKKVLNLKEEGSSQGDVKALDCVGSLLTCSASSGVGTVTLSSSASGGWTDNGTQINLTTSSDTVGIGNATQGKVSITGSSDIDQLYIKGNGTQTAHHLIHVVASDNTERFSISGDGTLIVAGNSTPGMILGNNQTTNYGVTFDVSGTDTKMVGTSGNVSFSHDITVSGDNITMLTNTKGGMLVADGTTFGVFSAGANGAYISYDSAQTYGMTTASITSYDRGVVVELTDAATITPNLDLGKTFRVTLGGNRTMATPINGVQGNTYIFIISQDTTGTRTITWSPFYRFGQTVASPTLSTVAGRQDYVGFLHQRRVGRVSADAIAFAGGYAEP